MGRGGTNERRRYHRKIRSLGKRKDRVLPGNVHEKGVGLSRSPSTEKEWEVRRSGVKFTERDPLRPGLVVAEDGFVSSKREGRS